MHDPQAAVSETYVKFQRQHAHLHGAFGADRFGAVAEGIARFFGTPKYLVGQTVVVSLWIIFNAAQLLFKPFDPYPYILLNLCFSLQAAYAAPLILLAQTRQAERDKAHEEAAARHRDELAGSQQQLLEQNTEITNDIHKLTEQVAQLTKVIHDHVMSESTGALS